MKYYSILATILTGTVVLSGCAPVAAPNEQEAMRQPVEQSVQEETQEEEESAAEESEETKEETTEEREIEFGYRYVADPGDQYPSFRPYNEPGKPILVNESAAAELEERGETIESFDVPFDPKNDSIMYISTSSNTNLEKSTNKIYAYNTSNGDLDVIYEEEAGHILRTIGREGSKIIIMVDGIDNSPGGCFSIWGSWDDIQYIDLDEVSNDLQEYTVPQYMIDEGKAEQEECLAGLVQ